MRLSLNLTGSITPTKMVGQVEIAPRPHIPTRLAADCRNPERAARLARMPDMLRALERRGRRRHHPSLRGSARRISGARSVVDVRPRCYCRARRPEGPPCDEPRAPAVRQRRTSGGLDAPGWAFWVDGSLRISPNEQVEVLRRFYEGKLGLSERAVGLTRDIMLAEGLRPGVSVQRPAPPSHRARTRRTGTSASWKNVTPSTISQCRWATRITAARSRNE